MHISAKNLRYAAHRTLKYGCAAQLNPTEYPLSAGIPVLGFQPNCTILRKPFRGHDNVTV